MDVDLKAYLKSKQHYRVYRIINLGVCTRIIFRDSRVPRTMHVSRTFTCNPFIRLHFAQELLNYLAAELNKMRLRVSFETRSNLNIIVSHFTRIINYRMTEHGTDYIRSARIERLFLRISNTGPISWLGATNYGTPCIFRERVSVKTRVYVTKIDQRWFA